MAKEVQRLKIKEPIVVNEITIQVYGGDVNTEIVKYSDGKIAVIYTSKETGQKMTGIISSTDEKIIWQKAQQQQG